MGLKLTFKDDKLEAIGSSNSELMEALEVKMSSLMTRLQEAARAKLEATKSPKSSLSGTSETGRLSESISNPRADIEGSNIVGRLDWGKDVPYAKIQEYGGTRAYIINPLGRATPEGPGLGGTKKHIKGAIRRFGADVLRFIGTRGGGPEVVYAPSVFRRTPLPARMFMHEALNDLRGTIIEEMRETITSYLQDWLW